MPKKIFEVPPPNSGAMASGALHYSAAPVEQGKVAIFRPYNGDIVLLDPVTESHQSISLGKPITIDISHLQSAESYLQAQTACFAPAAEGGFFIHRPGEQKVTRVDANGETLFELPCPFSPFSLASIAGNRLLLFGVDGNHLVHFMNRNGELIRSYSPGKQWPSGWTSRLQHRPFATDRHVAFSSAGTTSSFALLIETTAGIIDLLEAHDGTLKKRFIMLTRDAIPIARHETFLAKGPRALTSADGALLLTFPQWFRPAISALNGGLDGYIATVGCGRHILTLDQELCPKSFLSLENALREFPEVMQMPKPAVTSVFQVNSALIACCSNGALLRLRPEELYPVRPYDCIHEFRAAGSHTRNLTIASSGASFDADLAGRVPKAAIPELSDSEIARHRDFWLGLRHAAYEFDLEIRDGGVVNSAVPAAQKRYLGVANEDPSETNHVLMKLMRMNFRFKAADPGSKFKLRVVIAIDPVIDSLISNIDGRLLQTLKENI